MKNKEKIRKFIGLVALIWENQVFVVFFLFIFTLGISHVPNFQIHYLIIMQYDILVYGFSFFLLLFQLFSMVYNTYVCMFTVHIVRSVDSLFHVIIVAYVLCILAFDFGHCIP